MNIIKTAIEGVFIIEPEIFGDGRGCFFESYNKREFERFAGKVDFVQDNESHSHYGVVRGLHFQKGKHAQAKLVRVVSGKVLDIAVDIRPDSPTFGKHVSVLLSGSNHRQLFIPGEFAHGFGVLSKEAVFQYKCDNFYDPGSEGAIMWNDPDLGINWMIPVGDVILSEKDRHNLSFSDFCKMKKI